MDHHRQRKIFSPAFSESRLRIFAPVFQRVSKNVSVYRHTFTEVGNTYTARSCLRELETPLRRLEVSSTCTYGSDVLHSIRSAKVGFPRGMNRAVHDRSSFSWL